MGELTGFKGGFDECKQRLNGVQTVINEFRQDLQNMSKARDKAKQEIRDFEDLLAEYKASNENLLHQLKKNIDLEMVQQRNSQDEIKQQYQQIKVQIRNQVHHHTELAKQIAFDKITLERMVEETDGIVQLKREFAETEVYLHKY